MFFHDEDRKRAYEINDRAYKSAKALDLALEKLDKLIEDQLAISEQIDEIQERHDDCLQTIEVNFEKICKYFNGFKAFDESQKLKKRGRPKNVGA